MIVPMKKLSVLLYHTESDAFLRALQDIGVVHLVQEQDKDQTSLHETEQRVRRCDDALAFLNRFASARTDACPQRSDRAADEVLEELERLEALHAEHERELHELRRMEEALVPWGDFNPETVKRLRDAGIAVHFYAGDEKTYAAAAAAGLLAVPVARHQAGLLFFVCGTGDASVGVDAEEIALTEQSLSDVRRGLKRVQEDLERVEADICACAAYRDLLHGASVEQKNRLRFLSAMLDLKPCVGGRILAVTGWFPAAREKEIARFLNAYHAWFCCDDPGPDDDVPVLLENNRFVRLFEPITKLYMLPQYRELDPTPLLAPFFTLFVGLCIGDVAYGALMLLTAAYAYPRVKPAARSYVVLGGVFGLSTCLCGFMLNSFFGQTLCAGPGIPQGSALLPGGSRYCLLSPYTTADGIMEFPAMSFSLLLGFIQILIAMTVQSFVHIREGRIINGCKPLSYIALFVGMLIWGAHRNTFGLDIRGFSIGAWNLGAWLIAPPQWAGQALCAGGVVMLLWSASPGSRLHLRPMLGLWALYQFLTGLLGDLLSYIRLFALGLCSGLLGSTFNGMAMGLLKDGDVADLLTPWIVFAALLLVVGHCLNFALSLVGAFVHPLRLTFVEFFKNLEFTWGGKPFTPFCRISTDKNRL